MEQAAGCKPGFSTVVRVLWHEGVRVQGHKPTKVLASRWCMEQAAGCEPGILIILSYLAEMRVTPEQLHAAHILPIIDTLRQARQGL